MSVNKVILVGNLGKDPELRETNSGKSVCKFSLATKSGENTEWHNIVCWNKTAELAAQYLSKGRQVYLEGRIQTRQYDKDGETRYITEIVANQLTFLGKREDGGGNQRQGTQKPSDDDLPF